MMMTARPFAIGLCISEQPLHPQQHQHQSSSFEGAAAHQLHHHPTQPIPDTVPAHPFIAHVDYATTESNLSAAFDIPEDLAATEWMLRPPPPPPAVPISAHRNSLSTSSCSSSSSSSTSSLASSSSSASTSSDFAAVSQRKSRAALSSYRFTPRSVIDTHLFSVGNGQQHSQSSSQSSLSPGSQSSTAKGSTNNSNNTSTTMLILPSGGKHIHVHAKGQEEEEEKQVKTREQCDMDYARECCKALQLDIARFASLFIAPDSPAAAAICFAQNLTVRLERQMESSLIDSDDEYFGTGSVIAKGMRCGLDMTKSHRHIQLACDGHAAYKIRPSMYRTTRSRVPVLKVSGLVRRRQCSYFEVVVAVDNEMHSTRRSRTGAETEREGCGVCIGVATMKMGSDRMVGSDESSVGLHCSGCVVRKSGTFESPGHENAGFDVGDTVGVAVYTDGSGDAGVAMFVNGKLSSRVTVQEGGRKGQQALHAAVSLYKPGVKVVLVCCKEEWKMTAGMVKEAIGMRPDSMCLY